MPLPRCLCRNRVAAPPPQSAQERRGLGAPAPRLGCFSCFAAGSRGCYETVPSLRDSENFSHCTQHSAFGSVLGYHDSAPTALGSYRLFHRCDNERNFVVASQGRGQHKCRRCAAAGSAQGHPLGRRNSASRTSVRSLASKCRRLFVFNRLAGYFVIFCNCSTWNNL